MAEIYKRREQDSEAIEFYKKIIELNPEDLEAKLDLARMYEEVKKIDLAVNRLLTAYDPPITVTSYLVISFVPISFPVIV